MRNENGITLVEILAALAIVGIITAVIASVLITGTSSADRTSSKQQLQQEANYIVEVIRAEYLKNGTLEIDIKADSPNKKLLMDENVVSEGYSYLIHDLDNLDYDPVNNIIFSNELNFFTDDNIRVKIDIKDGKNQIFTIDTTFSKVR
ncbi:type II secretion system protein [Planococcus sp. CAU13]|uniref:type II secretion system protein n=1 Tax=Planococcus sp. CAU13 TaxID=1541197 RepID=UPI00068B44E3|nr:type II secretion system protein [Planococcus sp. CAU13]